jgi:stage II sporulation protein AA (anti-sigma F factor antagonist)
LPGEQPTMEVRAERAGSAVVVHLEGGRLVVEEDTHRLHELVRTVTSLDHACSVVLDLEKVWQLDCSGIGQLVELSGQVCESGGVFSLVNVGPRPKRLLAMLGLLRVLPVFASWEEAVTASWSAKARGCAPRVPQVEARTLAVRSAIEGALQLAPAT